MYLFDLFGVFHSDFQEFFYANKIIVLSASWSIGLATKEIIERILNLIIFPFLIYMVHLGSLHKIYEGLTEYVSETFLDETIDVLGKASWDIFVWLSTIIFTFILLEYVLNRKLIGLKSTIKSDDEIDYIKSKAEAKDSIIPDQEKINTIKVLDEKEIKAGIALKNKPVVDQTIAKKVTSEIEKFDLWDFYKLNAIQ